MNTQMFKLGWKDAARGADTAVFAGIMVALYGVVTAPGFDVFAADWASLARVAVNAGFGAFLGYMVKNFFSDENGKLFGKI